MKRILVAMCGLALVASAASAAMPAVISFQARLSDNADNAVSVATDMTFRLYTAATGGSEVWNEGHIGVTPRNGLLAVMLGTNNTFASASLDFSQPLWLQVEIGGEVLSPRFRMGTVPYAMRAASAARADAIGSLTESDLTAMQGQVAATTADVAANAAGIATNATGVAQNATDVAANAAGVASNATGVVANAADIGTNTTAIATNAADIGTNTTAITTNATDIGANTTAIAVNAADIDANTVAISAVAADVLANGASIGTNSSDIAANATGISDNAVGVAANAAAIAANVVDIADNAGDIGVNADKIADNEVAIATNVADIADNETAIAANTADIADNAGEIGVNAGKIADNEVAIAGNAAGIADNAGDIGVNAGKIADNEVAIAANTADIADNAGDIGVNSGNIADNEADIATNVTDIATNAANIAANSAPPVALLKADYTESFVLPQTVTLNASESYDPGGGALTFAWDPYGRGAFAPYGLDDTKVVDYHEGTFLAAVRVKNGEGLVDESKVLVRASSALHATVSYSFSWGRYVDAAIVNGQPAIACHRMANARLAYARANDVNGSSWGAVVNPDTTVGVGTFTSLAVVAGRPGIAYYDFTNTRAKYVWASNIDGTSWGPPYVVRESTGMEVGNALSLCNVFGMPAVATHDSGGHIVYQRALTPTGASWTANLVVADQASPYMSVCMVNGRPAMAYHGGSPPGIRYTRANNDTGLSWTAGADVAVDLSVASGERISMVIVDGRPAIAYVNPGSSELLYVRADDVDGTSWGTPVSVESAMDVQWPSMAVIGGRPCISVYDGTSSHLRFARAVDSAGALWRGSGVLSSETNIGPYSSVVDIGGRAGIAYIVVGAQVRFAYLP